MNNKESGIERQKEEGWCFPASAKFILRRFGETRTQEELGIIFGTTKEKGTALAGIERGFAQLGYRAEVREDSRWEDIEKAVEKGWGVIVDWWHDLDDEPDGHYSVVKEISRNEIVLLDPEIGGKRTLERKDFERKWWDIEENDERERRVERCLIVVYKF